MKRETVLVATVIITILVAYGVATRINAQRTLRPGDPVKGDFEIFYTIKTVISTVNIVLLAFLLFSYVELYRKIRSDFTTALIIFSIVLLLYALTSNPILHRFFGYKPFGLGPFAMLPDFFTCIAVIILLYLNYKY